MWKYQYDDAYIMVYEDERYFRTDFLDYEEEEAYARAIKEEW